ncbi:hypothetical protein GSI_05471 [Ganoderma sinense ZZ0214-1]|uniref:Uncharacterized protein n=1 Tax=Ganoderma sinense ZZ0214-1 TaxID=1077348 RepID=A0A2G8SEM7_9APHY|nr:hypothetical protein GSI_05471 [Ganoderma sinense ZZ0214-1]
MGNVLEAAGGWHVHGVGVDTNEDGGGRLWDGGWKEDLAELSRLTEVACADVPDDVGLHVRPPEAEREERVRGVGTLVCDIVVGLLEDVEALRRPEDKAVVTGGTTAPEPGVVDIEAGGEAVKRCEGVVRETVRSRESIEVAPDREKAVIFSLGHRRARDGDWRRRRCWESSRGVLIAVSGIVQVCGGWVARNGKEKECGGVDEVQKSIETVDPVFIRFRWIGRVVRLGLAT